MPLIFLEGEKEGTLPPSGLLGLGRRMGDRAPRGAEAWAPFWLPRAFGPVAELTTVGVKLPAQHPNFGRVTVT